MTETEKVLHKMKQMAGRNKIMDELLRSQIQEWFLGPGAEQMPDVLYTYESGPLAIIIVLYREEIHFLRAWKIFSGRWDLSVDEKCSIRDLSLLSAFSKDEG